MSIIFGKNGGACAEMLEWFQRKELKYQASMYKQRFSVRDIHDVALLVSL